MKNGEMDGGVFRRSFFYPAPFQKNQKFKIDYFLFCTKFKIEQNYFDSKLIPKKNKV